MNREKESIRSLEPYVTNPTVCSVKLDANEGDRDLYLDLLKKLGESDLTLNYYPDDSYSELKKEINNYVGYEPKNITVGNGSSELLDLCVKTFVDKDETILSLDPTFSMYSIYAQVFSAKYIGAKAEDDFKLNVDSIIKDIKENNPKLVILCNPNNPTGSVLTKEEVRKIVKSTDALIALDEAYMEFGDESLIDEVMDYDNLLIVKTVSKAFSLAGIRMGYIVANEEIITSIEKVRAPYNLNSLSTYVATEALRQKERMFDYVKKIKEEREKIYKALVDLGVKAYPSGANFVFFKSDIDDLQKKLVDKDVLIRKFSGKLDGYYRVSIGTKEQNEKFLEVFKEVM
ncbi:MAG: histidinol-phosphate transaminase [Intestinibacter bartlettii]|uniref:histidinol-phosphate transaminase n=1 Tax=Intestinibacter bartlettii TaxID=261299 RepID=UPI0026ED548C|nr:histidinol-phosphate transaminase [Intestinibacter bartlettii]MDO5010866.1 histidinol-phosphate transaminase [Intestinibacter bartlettii]